MPLQKSFSDQNHSSRARLQQQQNHQRWSSRHKSFNGQPTPHQNGSSRPLQEKPPVPVSTATRNKLNAFQYGASVGSPHAEAPKNTVMTLPPDDDDPDKENTRVNSISFEKKRSSPEEKLVPPDFQTKAAPSTPSARLALPDLIGMGDVVRTVQDVSPDERIEWDTNKDDDSSYTSSFGVIRRAKKRARSSSPVNSSPAASSNHFSSRSGVAHPSIDPGSELWGRYSLNGSYAPTPKGATIPALAHLMHTSSPQTHKEGTTPRSVNSLRRATSCGNQFPKRRRLNGPDDDDVFTESVQLGPSKLSVLIERVKENMPLSRQSSPPSTKSRSPQVAASSSLRQHDTSSPIHPKENRLTSTHTTLQSTHVSNGENEASPTRSFTSDYGELDDDELNETALQILQVDHTQPVLSHSKISASPRLPDLPQPSSQTALDRSLQTSSHKTSGSSGTLEDADEFGDFDEDAFGDDLAQVLSQFDRTPVQTRESGAYKKTNDRRLENTSAHLRRKDSTPQKAMLGVPDSHTQKGRTTKQKDSDDEFGDDGVDDMDLEAAEAAATQSFQQTANSLLPSAQKKAIQRYLITNILDSEFENQRGQKRKEKILLLQVDKDKTPKLVHLRGTWWDSPITVNAYVHVIGLFNGNRCIIDDENGLLILHPDHLLSSTVVADSFGCARRAVLQDRVKATNEMSAPLVYGTLLHEIFQAAMIANRWDLEWLTEVIEDVATRHLEDLYTIKIQIPAAAEYLQSKMTELQSWARLFVSSQPKAGAVVKAGNGEKASMCVSKLLDVEEHIWSPMYGLKGNIDATVQVVMQDEKTSRTLTVPFELKTGKNPSASHRAQTALYNLLLSDRYDVEIAYGILYYMETSETIRIPAIRHELRHMIMQRNELACFVRERHAQLPPMLKKENMCKRCYAKTSCFIYHKLADDGNGETSGMKAKFDEVVKHLTPKHKEFFLKWDDLLTKEERESLKFRRELWTMLSSEREKLGRCFSNVVIEPGSAFEEQNNPKINRFRYVLVKETAAPEFSFVDSQITVGEPIVISDENGHFALANGYVTNVRKRRITVAVDRRLHNARIRQPGFDDVENQVFASIMEVGADGSKLPGSTARIPEEPIKYRLDKDEFSNGMSTVRNNLIQTMADGPFGSRQIRGLVVDLNAPRFKTESTQYTLKDRESINVDQRRAIQKVMSAEDYALVLGMPGTGKTTTIAHIIRALVSQGKSVLLTSYTHTAVDNILLKLKEDCIPILRLGTIAKIHPDVQEFATLAVHAKGSFEEIRSAWHDSPIVATTCLGINHPIFSERTFDYCIVDEASQITLPVCLGPIRLARTFILVGDHNQLPPLVQNDEARTGGLDVSLFKHLSDTHPSSVVYLEHQYRMCEDVMTLSNNLIYAGRLKCGSEAVALRSIIVPNIEALRVHHFSPSTVSRSQRSICLGQSRCWIRELIAPSTKVAFVNTDPLLPNAREEAKGNRIVNPTEAKLVAQLVESLLTVGVSASSIGVMTHYRSQLALLKDGLRNHKEVEMHTADRFQGRDKEVIILSLVRSNEAKSIGELLKDWRRINVAFTRAKTKLLVIGSKETLKGIEGNTEMVAKFIALMEEKNWIFDLPKGALDDHLFEYERTQASLSSIGTQFRIREDGEHGKVSEKEKRKYGAEAHGKGNVTRGMRRPTKKVMGQKPFKIPSMGVLNDVVNEALG